MPPQNPHRSRSVAFISIPNFPIAVERALSPGLRGRPVVLTQSPNPRSRCLSVSPEARAFAIRRDMRLGDARRRCRDLAVLHPNPPLYQRALTAVGQVVAGFTPTCEPARAGQNYLDLTGTERLWGNPESVMATVRGRLASELRLPAEAGLAVNKLVSRIAALDSPPEGLRRVDAGCEEPFLAPHWVGMLPSVDREVRTTLTDLNVQLVEQVKSIHPDHLLTAIGPAAFALRRQAAGIDPEPVSPPTLPPRLTLAEELAEDTVDSDAISAVLARMAIEGAFQLHRKGNVAGELELVAHYSDGRRARGVSRSSQPADSTGTWMKIAGELHRRVITRRVRVRRLELVFHRLEGRIEQMGLWSAATPHSKAIAQPGGRFDRALEALEQIRARFGAEALTLGVG